MIGAALPGMTTTPSAVPPQAANPPAGAGAGDTDPLAQSNVAAAGNPAGRGTVATAQGRPGAERDDTATPSAFAELLAQSPLAAPPPAPAPAPAPAAAGAEGVETSADAPASLLALLDGSWNAPRAAMDAPLQGPPVTQAGPARGIQLPSDLAKAAAAVGQPAPQSGPDAAGDAPAGSAALFAAELATAAASSEAPASVRDAAAAQPGAAIESAAAPAPAAPARTAAAPQLPPLQMPADPGAGFDDGLGTRVVWMAEQRLGHAEIRLNPEHIGPIEVRVELDGEQVRAEFHSAHAEVRQAIEGSLPRLRELLGQHGLQLGHADVGQGQAGREGGDARANASARGGDAGGSGEDLQPRPAPVRARGLVDEYA